jgi:hypothetical protein
MEKSPVLFFDIFAAKKKPLQSNFLCVTIKKNTSVCITEKGK